MRSPVIINSQLLEDIGETDANQVVTDGPWDLERIERRTAALRNISEGSSISFLNESAVLVPTEQGQASAELEGHKSIVTKMREFPAQLYLFINH